MIGQPFNPAVEILERTVLHGVNVEIDRIEQAIGNKIGIRAKLAKCQILKRIVAHHEHILSRKTEQVEVFLIIGKLRLY